MDCTDALRTLLLPGDLFPRRPGDLLVSRRPGDLRPGDLLSLRRPGDLLRDLDPSVLPKNELMERVGEEALRVPSMGLVVTLADDMACGVDGLLSSCWCPPSLDDSLLLVGGGVTLGPWFSWLALLEEDGGVFLP